MKKLIGIVIFLTAFSLRADSFKLDAAHTRMGFRIPHLVISSVSGSFGSYSGTFEYDAAKNKLSNFKVVIDPSSINTSDTKRDNHLKGEDFFDIKKYPEIKFESDEIISSKKSGSDLKGKLTLHGITKEIKLKVIFKGAIRDPWGNQRIALEISGSVNRKDFGMNWNKALDEGGVMIGEDVEILVEAECLKN